MEDFWVFFAVGFLAQLIDGAMGMAYGVVSASMLMTFGVPPANVSASVHAAKVFTGAASATSHTLAGNVDRGLLVRLALAGMVGGIVGAYVLTGIDASVMRPFMAAWLGLMGLFILYRAWRAAPPRTVPFKAPFPLGFIGGLMDAIGGGGWGPTVTSTLIGAGSNPRHAIGTANTSEFFVAVATSIAFLTALITGRWEQADDLLTHAWAVGGLIAGGVLAAPFASLITRFLPVRGMMWAVGALVVGLCGYQFWRVLAAG